MDEYFLFFYIKKGMGQPTHVLVDTLQHPAVELTQAEGAAVDSADVSDTSSASSSSSSSLDLVSDYFSDDWMIIITGVVGGCFGCVLLLAIVSLTMRRYYKVRGSGRSHNHTRSRDSNSLNNSESSSEKGSFSDPTITSDNMILMTNGEIDFSHQHLHPCIQKQKQEDVDPHTEATSGFQHVTVGARQSLGSENGYQNSSTLRKGILKHHPSGAFPSGRNDNPCLQQAKPDVTIAANGGRRDDALPTIPPKVKQTTVNSITSSENVPGCQEHLNEFGR